MPFRMERDKLIEPGRARMERAGARHRTRHQIPLPLSSTAHQMFMQASSIGFGGDQDIPGGHVVGEGLTGRFALRVRRHRFCVRFNVP